MARVIHGVGSSALDMVMNNDHDRQAAIGASELTCARYADPMLDR